MFKFDEEVRLVKVYDYDKYVADELDFRLGEVYRISNGPFDWSDEYHWDIENERGCEFSVHKSHIVRSVPAELEEYV